MLNRKLTMEKDRINIEKGSGNIYKDLSNSHPEDMQAKAHIVFKIEDSITERKLSLDDASQIMNITETELSDILDGLFRNLSLKQLESLFAKLKHGIESIHQNKPSKSTTQERSITSSAD